MKVVKNAAKLYRVKTNNMVWPMAQGQLVEIYAEKDGKVYYKYLTQNAASCCQSVDFFYKNTMEVK